MALLGIAGCAVTRDQESVGGYLGDSANTAISVGTLKGTVMLSGFARSTSERNTAENLARGVQGIKAAKNAIVVTP